MMILEMKHDGNASVWHDETVEEGQEDDMQFSTPAAVSFEIEFSLRGVCWCMARSWLRFNRCSIWIDEALFSSAKACLRHEREACFVI